MYGSQGSYQLLLLVLHPLRSKATIALANTATSTANIVNTTAHTYGIATTIQSSIYYDTVTIIVTNFCCLIFSVTMVYITQTRQALA